MLGRCVHCGCQLHTESKSPPYVWQDNSGGDVCGWNGGNEPHVDILDDETQEENPSATV